MNDYIPRLADDIISFRLESKGAVLIEGPKGSGKTTTALRQAGSAIHIDDPLKAEDIRIRASIEPSLLLEGDVPRLLDEWQGIPELWDTVRMEVDRRDGFGQFLLTGSSVPREKDRMRHSGTGRITRLLMRPMSLSESGESSSDISLSELFRGNFSGRTAERTFTLEDMAFLICRGGWPAAVRLPKKKALMKTNEIFKDVVDSEIIEGGARKRKSETARFVMRTYARNIGTQISSAGMIRDMAGCDGKAININTFNGYLSDLKRIFVFEDCPAWNPNLRSKTAIRTTDTRYYMDPSVGAAALGAGPGDLVSDLRTMGFFFENMAIRDLRIYADAIGGEVRHYRDKNNLECDAVIHLRNGRYGLVEIKLGGDILVKEGIKTLSELEERLDTDRMGKPAFMMILTAVGNSAFIAKNGIYVVPITMLGA